jgi:hypothetical protein
MFFARKYACNKLFPATNISKQNLVQALKKLPVLDIPTVSKLAEAGSIAIAHSDYVVLPPAMSRTNHGQELEY